MTKVEVNAAGVVAVVPARGGSKGLPGKNLRTVEGSSLVRRAVAAGKDSGVCGTVCVTTDDDRIADEGAACGAKVVRRPAHLATDEARTIDAVLHAIDELGRGNSRPTTIVLLQPTSPFRTAEHVREAVSLFYGKRAGSVFSVTESEHPPQKMFLTGTDGMLAPLFAISDLETPRQHLPRALRQNGAIYVVDTDDLARCRSFFVPPAFGYEMDRRSSLDIDIADDLAYAEFLAASGHP